MRRVDRTKGKARKTAARSRAIKPKTHSALRDECWSIVSTLPSGMGLISGGMTYDEALVESHQRQVDGHNGVVIMTDEAAGKIGARPIDISEIRDSKTPLVTTA